MATTQIEFSEKTPAGQSKVERYNWKDPGERGEFRLIPKQVIHIPEEYQRQATESKVATITREFDWSAFGVVTIVYRGEVPFAVDGWHRVMGAWRRDDIDLIPCLVFKFDSLPAEAEAFLRLNTLRRPLTSSQRHNALKVSEDPLSTTIDAILTRHGVKAVARPTAAGQLKCLTTCRKIAAIDSSRLDRTIQVAAQLSFRESEPIVSTLLFGLSYLDRWVEGGLANQKLLGRVMGVGAVRLVAAAQAHSFKASNASAKTWGLGMLNAINDGHPRSKIKFIEDAGETT